MPRPAFDLTLYLVTDRPLCRGRSLSEVARAAVNGGATLVQIREKDAPTRLFLEQAWRPQLQQGLRDVTRELVASEGFADWLTQLVEG